MGDNAILILGIISGLLLIGLSAMGKNVPEFRRGYRPDLSRPPPPPVIPEASELYQPWQMDILPENESQDKQTIIPPENDLPK